MNYKKLIKSISYLLVLYAVILLAGCKKDDCQSAAKQNCICTQQYDPVCGCNKKTYGNSCMAECDGIEKYTQGECK